MHFHGLTLSFLLPSLATYVADSVIAIPSVIASPPDLAKRDPSPLPLSERADVALLSVRDSDGHGHGHGDGNAVSVVEFNETEVLLYHAPTPPSYWSIDIDNSDSRKTGHPGLMALHALSMVLAFLGALPAGSSWHAP